MVEPKIIQFYKGNIKSISGYFFDDILKFSDLQLETKHDFIQSLFPLFEKGMADSYLLNKKAIKIFKENKKLKIKVLSSLLLMINFYGYEFIYKEKTPIDIKRIKPIKRILNNTIIGLYSSNNYLRITRIIKFLKLIDLDYYALLFMIGICKDLKSDKKFYKKAKNSIKFWKKEIFND